jgi:predicted ABC-type ATPase
MQIYSDKVLYLIGGPNGSGKTTLARELIGDNPNITFLNADDIARDYNVSPLKAGAILMDKMHHGFSVHASFAFETTLSGRYHNSVIKHAKSDGYKIVFLYVFLSSVEQNIARVRQRVALGGHDVPESTIRRRYSKSIMNFEPVAKQSDQWELYYNGGTQYELLAHGIHEQVSIINNPMYSMFMERSAKILSDHLLELAQRAACRARITALNAGVPVVIVER